MLHFDIFIMVSIFYFIENIPSTSVFAEEIGYDAIDLENSKKIERMTKDEVLKAQQEILERFGWLSSYVGAGLYIYGS